MNKEELGIIKEQLPREELVEHYKSISKLNKKYCNDNIELQQRIDKAIEYTEEILSQTKGLIGDYEYHIEEHKEILALLYDDKKVFKKQLSILRGEDNE